MALLSDKGAIAEMVVCRARLSQPSVFVGPAQVPALFVCVDVAAAVMYTPFGFHKPCLSLIHQLNGLTIIHKHTQQMGKPFNDRSKRRQRTR
jgi:hypothetical protein